MIIPGFSNYDITTDGVVTHVSTGAIVKQYTVTSRSSKYARVSIKSDDGYIRAYNVMTLLALTYLGKPLHEGVVRSKDGNNLNVTLSNVEWTTQSSITAQMWRDGKISGRHVRESSYNEDSINMVYETMLAYDAPVSMAELSCELQVSYTTVRYSMTELRKRGKVRKTKGGFEVIR